MAQIVAGVGASHTTLMNTRWDEVDHLPRAHAFRDGLAEARRQLAGLDLDACVIVGTNHFRGFWLDLMPPFTVGVDVVTSAGEHGTPTGELATSPALARAIHQGLLNRDFDVAMSTDLTVDHGISHAVQYVVPEHVPIVPLVVNIFGPPLPSIGRCVAIGRALADTIDSLDQAAGANRLAVIGTGGLSHTIPFPDWRQPDGPTEEFLAESFRHGRGRWQEYEERRRPLVVGAEPRISEAFDTNFLDQLEQGQLEPLAATLTNGALTAAAGNGGDEIRTWLTMAAALGFAPGERLVYSPMPEWLTGMAVALIRPSSDGSSRDQEIWR